MGERAREPERSPEAEVDRLRCEIREVRNELAAATARADDNQRAAEFLSDMVVARQERIVHESYLVNKGLEAEVTTLRARVAALSDANADLLKDCRAAEARVARLEEALREAVVKVDERGLSAFQRLQDIRRIARAALDGDGTTTKEEHHDDPA